MTILKFSEEDYRLVEKILIKDGKFNIMQREFIELFDSKVILAGPGAGKTTSLAAKIILLLKTLSKTNSKNGVCIITHTNVAVKEINNALQKTGINKISHPHFIGTIHEFFNRFCVIPYYKSKFGHSSLIFESSKESDIDFYKMYIGSQIPWIKKEKYKKFYREIAERTYRYPLILDREDLLFDLINDDNWDKFLKYRSYMLEAKLLRKKQGYLGYDDTFLFSERFLSISECKHILRRRFKYIFIDEFQDTTVKGIQLLKKIFDTEENIMQQIGDPYQTINYNQPIPINPEEIIFRMNLSNRFGSQISNPLNVIIPEADVKVQEAKISFKPIILIYKNEEEIYDTYQRIIFEHEQQHTVFRECGKEDKILVWNSRWAPRIKSGIIYSKEKNKGISINKKLMYLVIDYLSSRFKEKNIKETREWVKRHPKTKELISLLLEILKFGYDQSRKIELKNIINHILTEKGQASININNSIFEKISSVLEETSESKNEDYESYNEIFTVHSVKGETLRSALVADFEGSPLINILYNQYGISKDRNFLYTNQNLLYVAISRVEHLFIIAIHEELFPEGAKDKLKNHWTIMDTNS